MKRIALAALLCLGTSGALRAEDAAAPAVKRTVLMKQDSAVAGREAVMVQVELAPGAAEGKHTHAAEVFAFVVAASSASFEVMPSRYMAAWRCASRASFSATAAAERISSVRGPAIAFASSACDPPASIWTNRASYRRETSVTWRPPVSPTGISELL